MRPPFFCDFGYNIRLGDNVFLNFNCVILDINEVTIGDRTQIGPMVQIYAADHPRDAKSRAEGLEFGRPVTIGADVWIGGGAILVPGVTIGDGAVIGAGSWGTAVAVLLARGGVEVQLGCRTAEQAAAIQKARESSYLPGIGLSGQITVKRAADIEVAGLDLVCLAVPSAALPAAVARTVMVSRPSPALIATPLSAAALIKVIVSSPPSVLTVVIVLAAVAWIVTVSLPAWELTVV